MRILLSFAFVFLPTTTTFAQDIMMQAWHWGYPSTINGQRFIKHLETQVPYLASKGINHMWLPPIARGGSNNSMGYDIYDWYDLGQFSNTRWGNRTQFNSFMNVANQNNVKPIVDVIYNHRNGGDWEDNPPVEGWVENMNLTKINAGDKPFPSDRLRCYIPLGGTSLNGAGTYYMKFSSPSKAPLFDGRYYLVTVWTDRVAQSGVTNPEVEPNGGGDCSQGNNTLILGQSVLAQIEVSGCGTDEFAVTLTANDFNAAGDKLYFTFRSTDQNSGFPGPFDMTDQFAYGIWNGTRGANVVNEVKFQTATDYNGVPSGRGKMNHMAFRPNGSPTQLSGDEDGMWFFYDFDQTRQEVRDTMFAYTKWLWDNAGFRGFRLDAIKHFPAWFTGDLLDFMHQNNMNPGIVVGEAYDFDPAVLNGRIASYYQHMDAATAQNIQIRLFDFALRNQLKQSLDNNGYDVRNVFNNTMRDAGGSGMNAITFVDNHDFRPGAADPVFNNRVLGYAYILTNNQLGIPCIYYPDYYESGTTRAQINALIETHRRYIFGANQVTYLNNFQAPYPANYQSGSFTRSLIYQLNGSQAGNPVVVAINFSTSPLRVTQTVANNGLAPGDQMTDIMGTTNQAITQITSNREINIDLPPKSFAVYVKGDLRNNLIAIDSTPVSIDELPLANDIFEVLAYPNPFDEDINVGINIGLASIANITLVDMLGREVLRERWTLSQGENFLQLQVPASLPNGTYLLKIEAGGKFVLKKVVK